MRKFLCKKTYGLFQCEFIKGRYYEYYCTIQYDRKVYYILSEQNIFEHVSNEKFIKDKFLTEKQVRKRKLKKLGCI